MKPTIHISHVTVMDVSKDHQGSRGKASEASVTAEDEDASARAKGHNSGRRAIPSAEREKDRDFIRLGHSGSRDESE